MGRGQGDSYFPAWVDAGPHPALLWPSRSMSRESGLDGGSAARW